MGFSGNFCKILTNMKKSFVQLEFKSISSLILFQNPRPGFQVPNLTLVSIIYIVVVIFNCVVNYWLLPMYLNFSGLKKKSYCFCLFFIGCYFIFSLINTLVHVKIDQGIHYLVEEPITYACNFEKKNTIFGFSNHAKASVLILFSLQTFLLYNVLVSKEYV